MTRTSDPNDPKHASMSPDLAVRPAEQRDAIDWIRLRTALWPEEPGDHPDEIAAYFRDPPERSICFVAEADRDVVGFAEFGLRDYAEECTTSPVGYVEGIYVRPGARGTGAGRALVRAGEAWARTQGCTEMASDRALDNEGSGAFHEAIGFTEVHRIVCYRKELDGRS